MFVYTGRCGKGNDLIRPFTRLHRFGAMSRLSCDGPAANFHDATKPAANESSQRLCFIPCATFFLPAPLPSSTSSHLTSRTTTAASGSSTFRPTDPQPLGVGPADTGELGHRFATTATVAWSRITCTVSVNLSPQSMSCHVFAAAGEEFLSLG